MSDACFTRDHWVNTYIQDEVGGPTYDDVVEFLRKLKEEAESLTSTWQDMWETIQEGFLYFNPVYTPREYGMNLLKKKKSKNYRNRYSYIKTIQKNLPYMRRCFN